MKQDIFSIFKTIIAGFAGGLIALFCYNLKIDFQRFLQPPPARPALDSGTMPLEKGVQPAVVEQSRLPVQEYELSCSVEIEKFCSVEKAEGKGGVVPCLLDQTALSDQCVLTLRKFANRLAPCSAEAKKFCPGVKIGRGRLAECLRAVQTKISNQACLQLL